VAKLRPHGDSERDLFLIPDPTQTAINDGVVTAWQAFAKIVSIQHAVYFQAGLIACTVRLQQTSSYVHEASSENAVRACSTRVFYPQRRPV